MQLIHPTYVILKDGDRFKDTISYKNKQTGNRLTLDYNTPEDETLSNQFLHAGIVESVPSYVDPNGISVPLQPGDLVWGVMGGLFSMEWHDRAVINTHPLRNYVHIGRISAYERGGKLYGMQEMDVNRNQTSAFEFWYERQPKVVAIHRHDLHFKVTARKSILIDLHEDLGFEFDLMGYSTYEIISEGDMKGKVVMVDMPAPFVVDRGQAEKKGFKTILEDGTYYCFSLQDAICEVEI